MVRLKSLRIDPRLQVEGVEVPWRQGVVLIVASGASREYHAAIRELARKDPAAWLKAAEDPLALRALQIPAIAEHLLRGWIGVDDDETGVALPYTKELGIAWLSDPELPDLLDTVWNAAHTIGNFRKRELANLSGN